MMAVGKWRLTKEDLNNHLAELGSLLADGFEDALVGYLGRFGQQAPIALYDESKCISILMERDGMTQDDAEEFFAVNVIGAWVGEKTPGFVFLLHEDKK